MEEQFVTYEIALKLKELGFNEWCWFQYYKGNLDYCYKYEKKSTNIPTIRTACLAPLWQQVIDWCDLNGLLIGTIIVDNLYKSTINKINYETELFHSRNESIKRAIEFAISYLQNNKYHK